MFDMNSGYSGYRMSNRAVEAYESGEKPRSKWTKKEIISEVAQRGKFRESDLKAYSREVLADYFLTRSSWHHTGKYCRETVFYSINDNAELGNLNELEDFYEECEVEKRGYVSKKIQIIKAKIGYLKWIGTRKHPVAVELTKYAIIIDGWAYMKDGKKKSTNANGFVVKQKFGRAPNGTSEEFKMIMEKLPVSVKKKIEGVK